MSQRSRNVLLARNRNVLLTDLDLDDRGQTGNEAERAGSIKGAARVVRDNDRTETSIPEHMCKPLIINN